MFALNNKGKALISDDTQMTLFTVGAMIDGYKRRALGQRIDLTDCIYDGYLAWLQTQGYIFTLAGEIHALYSFGPSTVPVVNPCIFAHGGGHNTHLRSGLIGGHVHEEILTGHIILYQDAELGIAVVIVDLVYMHLGFKIEILGRKILDPQEL